jgi:DNA-binding CsgD family transcriptional regulator
MLEETNTALKILLKHQSEETDTLERNILLNLKTLVLPYLEKMNNITLDSRIKSYLNIVKSNLNEITKPFAAHLDYHPKLTFTEIQIANLIRDNKTTNEIADMLHISESTVFSHRRHIREKLGIKKDKINLRSYLKSLGNIN